MRLVGFNFDKIHIEKTTSTLENLKISTKMDVIDINEIKPDLFKAKEELLGVKFSFGLDYEPDVAKIDLVGTMLLSVDSKIAKEVLRGWKDKQIPEEFRMTIFNIILKKATLRALRLEEEMNLPLHIQLPTLKKDQEPKT
jgi:hypothetical protein